MGKFLALVGVIGKDQKGVVARFATELASRGANIEDIEQRVVRGVFFMDMLVDLAEITGDLTELSAALLRLGAQIGMHVRVTPYGQRKPKRLVVLASREDHCLRQLLRDTRGGAINANVSAVLANHDTLGPVAREAGVPFESMPGTDPAAHFAWLHDRLKKLAPDVVALARYMRILPAEIVDEFPDRLINIHPSLLPFFPGAAPYRQAFESGVKISGCTAHFVTEQLDAGPVILQDVFRIDVGTDTLDDVRRKGAELEARTLGEAVRMFVDDELVVIEGGVVFKPGVTRFAGGVARR